MIRAMLNWIDENEELLMEKFAFGVVICAALGMISLQFIM